MKKEELLGKELSNLYAIAKQVKTYFDDSNISFLSEKAQQILVSYVGFSCRNEEQTSRILKSLEVNPGNTTDSIVQEIIENLHDIASQKGYSKEVRALGYMMSLNRLINYHAVNIDNLDNLVGEVYEKK